MTVKQLRAFLAVAQSLSFAQACERLHLSQPALSLAIKNLEQSLGGQLLVRTTRSVALTPEGETLLPIAVRLLADWDNAEDLLRQHFTLQMGKVAVAASAVPPSTTSRRRTRASGRVCVSLQAARKAPAVRRRDHRRPGFLPLWRMDMAWLLGRG